MTRIRPFRALRYDASRVDLSRVIVPPYDVITPEERVGLYDRDPHCAIRLELTRDVGDEASTDYADVARTLAEWTRSGVLVRDGAPAVYALRQSFVAPDGAPTMREGFFALLHLEDYERRIVRPHERTLAAPKADRLKQLRAAQGNLSSVFLLYEDRAGDVEGVAAGAFEDGELFRARDEAGTEHALARLSDPDRVRVLQDFLGDRAVVIADGHHRYETGLAYRDERRRADGRSDDRAPHEWLLAYFANAYAPGSLLLPIHRVIRKGSAPTDAAWKQRLPGWHQERLPAPALEKLGDWLADHLAPLADRHAFAADDATGEIRIFSRPRAAGDDLGVRVVHRDVIEGVFGLDEDAVRDGAIDYPKSATRAASDVRSGRGTVALYLNPLTPDEVFGVTAAGEVLPQKSTFFLPKLPTGLVFRPFEDAR